LLDKVQLIVDTINLFLAFPVHFCHFQVSLEIQFAKFVVDLLLNSLPGLEAPHKLGLPQSIEMLLKLALNRVHSEGF
jgi:hypothetical protein